LLPHLQRFNRNFVPATAIGSVPEEDPATHRRYQEIKK
jgi:hypothetical protein